MKSIKKIKIKMSKSNELDPQIMYCGKLRRSSFRNRKVKPHLDQTSLLKLKTKRNSISWGNSDTFQFKAMRAMFEESKDINKKSNKEEEGEKHKQFVETRRRSIKDEFLLVKEFVKNKMLEEGEDEIDEEVKKNTYTNIKNGHDALNEMSDSSTSPKKEDNAEKKGKHH
jgi:hypothetical protein